MVRRVKGYVASLEGIKVINNVEYWDKLQMEIEWGIDYMPCGYYRHVSFSKKDKIPNWEEVKLVKEKYFGDRFVFKVLPAKKFYVNLHEHCFHLFEYLGEKENETK